MTIVYATGRPGFLEFATASSARLLPPGATILAICDDGRTTDHLDECTFERMTDEEYCELQGLIKEMQQYEGARAERRQKTSGLRKLCRFIHRRRAYVRAESLDG